MIILLCKSFVAEHLRYLKSGKSVRVQSHYTKRVKKHTEHALAHDHNLDHLSDKDKDLFNRMHAEQHLAEFYDGHALRKRVAHHEAEAKKHNDHADELDKQGKHKEAAAARRKADKHTVTMHRHKADLKKVDEIVHGIAALKERLVAGSGKLEGDADAIHQHYVSKIGERLKPVAVEKPAAAKEPEQASAPSPAIPTATFDNGNLEITATVTGHSDWQSANGALKRRYYEVSATHKRQPIHKFYEVLKGTTKDLTIEVEGRKFAFEYGVDANSKTKREAIRDAVEQLAKQIVASPSAPKEPPKVLFVTPQPEPAKVSEQVTMQTLQQQLADIQSKYDNHQNTYNEGGEGHNPYAQELFELRRAVSRQALKDREQHLLDNAQEYLRRWDAAMKKFVENGMKNEDFPKIGAEAGISQTEISWIKDKLAKNKVEQAQAALAAEQSIANVAVTRGTEKQVKWANEIKAKLLPQVKIVEQDMRAKLSALDEEKRARNAAVLESALTEINRKFASLDEHAAKWIDFAGGNFDPAALAKNVWRDAVKAVSSQPQSQPPKAAEPAPAPAPKPADEPAKEPPKVLFVPPQLTPNAKAVAAAKAALEESKGQKRVLVSSGGRSTFDSFEDWASDMYDQHVSLMSPEDKAKAMKEYEAAKKKAKEESKGEKSAKATLSETAAAAKLNAVSKGGVALKGTPKQREWAEKIRQQRLSALTPDQAAIAVNPDGLFTNAKWWIETRDMDVQKLGAFFLAQKKLLALCQHLHSENKKDEYAKAAEIYNGLTGQFGFGTAKRGTDYLRLAQDHLRQAGIN